MQLTLSGYILNPMGKNNAVLNATAREAIRNSYIKKYDAILVRERGKIDYKLYKNKKKNTYYAHFKIPSETVEKFYYDTVLEFYADENIKNTNNLFDYNVKFYSNDPAFVYTYAYVFSHNDLFVEDLMSRMSKKALKTDAKEKNPSNQVGYVKTIYFAYLTMKQKGLNNLSKFDAECSSYSKVALLSSVEDADKKIGEREAEGAKLNKTKNAKKPISFKSSENVKPTQPSNKITKVKTTNTIGKISTVKAVKKSKRK